MPASSLACSCSYFLFCFVFLRPAASCSLPVAVVDAVSEIHILLKTSALDEGVVTASNITSQDTWLVLCIRRVYRLKVPVSVRVHGSGCASLRGLDRPALHRVMWMLALTLLREAKGLGPIAQNRSHGAEQGHPWLKLRPRPAPMCHAVHVDKLCDSSAILRRISTQLAHSHFSLALPCCSISMASTSASSSLSRFFAS